MPDDHPTFDSPFIAHDTGDAEVHYVSGMCVI